MSAPAEHTAVCESHVKAAEALANTFQPSTAILTFELAGVSSNAVAAAEARRTGNHLIAGGEAARQRALGALLHGLGENDGVSFVHAITGSTTGAPRYTMQIECRSRMPSEPDAIRRVLMLGRNLSIALAAGFPEFSFKSGEPMALNAPTRPAFLIALTPHGLASKPRHPLGLLASATTAESAQVRLPSPALVHQSFLECIVSALPSQRHNCEVRIDFQGRIVSESELERVVAATEQLLASSSTELITGDEKHVPGRLTSDQAGQAQDLLFRWMAHRSGAQLALSIASETQPPDSLARIAGDEILQGRTYSIQELQPEIHAAQVQPGDLASYFPAGSAVPPLFPDPRILKVLGFPPSRPIVQFESSAEGILLGESATPFGMKQVCLAEDARSQHCYIVGATGTGKSTLMLQMLQQDIMEGRGVALFDPHGDLYAQALESIPASRQDDIIALDFTRFDALPGINPLELSGPHPEMECNIAVRDLGEIFRRLYSSVPESLGPMFFLYMRNAVTLAMENPDAPATLLDIPQLFADDIFREFLLNRSQNSELRLFWRGIAHRAKGDQDLRNMAPYVLNKFAEFTENPLVRYVIGQQRSTINLRDAMDHKKILLVNLSKGALGESDSKFLGMLLTSRLFAAALGRNDVAPQDRVPFHLYLDEFQNFTAFSSMESIFAEARKYGLTLTIAHQNLGQLDSTTLQSVLSNSGTQIFMRLGAHDAARVAEFLSTEITSSDLNSLPDRLCIARMRTRKAVAPAVAFRTYPLERAALEDGWKKIQATATPSARHCTPVEVVKHQIEYRRHSYVAEMTPREAELSESLNEELKARGVQRLGEISALSPGERASILDKATNEKDHAVLYRVSRLMAYKRLQSRSKQK